ncbi:MAG: copper resistance protein NlpE N-terminal domain-containing protein [Flavobacteriales bacterium]|nr:copper resistance protein NlpE N-terminal domain-containing protein [Flavobacteriales bacterium]
MRTLLLSIPVLWFYSCITSDAGSSQDANTTVEVDTNTVPVEPVGLFSGTLPCADCPGISTEIWLRADSTYVQHATYQDRDTMPFGSIGSWSLNGNTVLLKGTPGARYELTDKGLRSRTHQEDPASARPPAELLKGVGTLLNRSMRITGGYIYADETHTLQPCGMEQQFPLGMQHAGLEMAMWYTEDNLGGTPMLVEIQAHLGMGPSMEGDEEDEYLFVENVLRRLNGSCPTATSPL